MSLQMERVDAALRDVYAPTFKGSWTDEDGRRFLQQLSPGENAMPGSPTATVAGEIFIPQQFLVPNHTPETVKELLSRVSVPEGVKLISYEDPASPGSVLLQVGLWGRNTYSKDPERPWKWLYGRVWRVEKHLPAPELLQTAFKAIGDAVEHEVRETFRWKRLHGLQQPCRPTYARPREGFHMGEGAAGRGRVRDAAHAAELLRHADLAGVRPALRSRTALSPDVIYELDVGWKHPLTVVARDASLSALLRAMMDGIIAEARREVAEGFRFDGEARFAESTSVPLLVAFQRATRRPKDFDFGDSDPETFAGVAAAIHRAIDETRRPPTA